MLFLFDFLQRSYRFLLLTIYIVDLYIMIAPEFDVNEAHYFQAEKFVLYGNR